jgi:hypothetical protein
MTQHLQKGYLINLVITTPNDFVKPRAKLYEPPAKAVATPSSKSF